MNTAYSGQPTSSFNFQHILYDKRGYRATVTFNRSEVLNAVCYPMLLELREAFLDISFDDSIAVLVLTGAGDRAFCTGADLNEQKQFVERPQDYWKWMGAFIEAHDRLRNLGKPSIARLNGIVVGGGNEFNMSCDLAIAADDIYIRHVGASHGSVAAAGATQWLPIIVGDRRAREILFSPSGAIFRGASPSATPAIGSLFIRIRLKPLKPCAPLVKNANRITTRFAPRNPNLARKPARTAAQVDYQQGISFVGSAGRAYGTAKNASTTGAIPARQGIHTFAPPGVVQATSIVWSMAYVLICERSICWPASP